MINVREKIDINRSLARFYFYAHKGGILAKTCFLRSSGHLR
jgi:hypothetical protein